MIDQNKSNHELAKENSALKERIRELEAVQDQSKRTEVEDRQAENIMSLVMDNSVVGIALVRNRTIMWANKLLSEMLGLSMDQVRGAGTRILYPSDEAYEAIGSQAYSVLSTGNSFEFDLVVKRPCGNTFVGRVLGKAVDPAFPLNGSIWMFEDITERKRAEDSLRESEKNFRTFFDTAGDMILVGDLTGKVIYANAAVEETLGYDHEELYRMNISDFIPLKSRKEFEAVFSSILREEPNTLAMPLCTKSGEQVPASFRGWSGRWNDAKCFFFLIKELTPEQETLELFERLFRSNPGLMALNTFADGLFVDVNDSFLKTLGYTREEVLGRSPSEIGVFVHSEQEAAVVKELKKFGGIQNHELKIRCKNGTIRTGLFSGDVIRSHGKKYLLTVMADITELKQAEETLRFMNALLRTQQETSLDGILVVDKESRIISFNQRFVDMWDIPADVITSRSNDRVIQSVLSRLNRPLEFSARIRNLMDNPTEKVQDEVTLEGGVTLEFYMAPITLGPGGEYYGRVWYFRDITYRKKVEEELRKSLAEKDALLGEIHHRVKNNLQIIASLLEMSKGRARTKETIDQLGDAHAKIFTMALIHSQLYQSERFDEINMEIHVRGLLNHLASLYGPNNPIAAKIRIRELYLPVTRAIPCALVLNELISNSFKHAFNSRERGKLLISMERKDDGIIEMEVADNGAGIPENVDMERTDTLGLKLVRNIVFHQLGGTLSVSARPGTRTRIEFPDTNQNHLAVHEVAPNQFPS